MNIEIERLDELVEAATNAGCAPYDELYVELPGAPNLWRVTRVRKQINDDEGADNYLILEVRPV